MHKVSTNDDMIYKYANINPKHDKPMTVYILPACSMPKYNPVVIIIIHWFNLSLNLLIIIILQLSSSKTGIKTKPYINLGNVKNSFFINDMSLEIKSINPITICTDILKIKIEIIVFMEILVLKDWRN